jgi:hypothetical protein
MRAFDWPPPLISMAPMGSLISPPNESTEACVNLGLARESNSFGNAIRLLFGTGVSKRSQSDLRRSRRFARQRIERMVPVQSKMKFTTRESAMSGPYIVASKSTEGVITTNVQYATVEDALRSLGNRSDNNARAMSIIDSEDHLVLPADQVRLRLHQRPEYVRGISIRTRDTNVAAG